MDGELKVTEVWDVVQQLNLDLRRCVLCNRQVVSLDTKDIEDVRLFMARHLVDEHEAR